MEAQSVLSQKSQVIDQYNAQIEEAEKELAQLKADYEAKSILLQQLESEENSDIDQQEDLNDESEIDRLKLDHEAEILEIKARHEDEIQTLQLNFTKALKEAESWAEQHADTILLGKKAELEALTQELELMKTTFNEDAFSRTQSRTRLYQQSKTQSMQNAQRISELDSQLSELSAITREELREVRGKIDECFVSVDIREREHKNEIEKYEKEIKNRETRFNAHIATINLN